jgi:UDP-glucose:(heptosyl)LPS alpha-1,3-glucosyltransferase
MKIALSAYSCDNRTGIGRVVKNLGEHFVAAGHTVDIIASHIDDVATGVVRKPLRSIPGPNSLDYLYCSLQARSAIRKGNYDISNSFGLGRGATVVTAQSCHRSGVEIERQFRRGRVGTSGWGIFDAVALAEEKTLMTAGTTRLIIAVAGLVRDQLQQCYKISPNKIRVIPNGVDLPGVDQAIRAVRRRTARARFRWRDNDFGLLFVANEFDRKGLQTIIRALPLLRDTNIRLAVVGSDDRVPFQRMAAQLDVSDCVEFAGSIRGAESLYAGADAFVLPTWYEPFGMVIIEAMAEGVPVITAAGAGAVEGMQHERHGLFLQDVRSADELASSVRRIRDDSRLRTLLASGGRDAARRFAWPVVAEETLSAYKAMARADGIQNAQNEP